MTDTVRDCVPRQDGGYWIITSAGRHYVATSAFPVGSRVQVRDGQLVRVAA